MTTPDPTPPAVSPVDTAALPEFEAASAPAGYDNEQSYAWASGTDHMRGLALPLLAGFLAELDRAHTERDKLGREVDRLHAELAGARPIPDDAAEREEVERLIAYHMPNADDTDADFLATALMEYFGRDAESLSTPTTGPAPAAADGQYVEDVQRGVSPRDLYRRDSDLRYVCVCGDLVTRADAHHDGRWVCLPSDHSANGPAAPQAPAEPTGRVWNVGAPEPTEDGLTVIDRDMTPDVIGRYNDPTWFREGPDRWSGPYAYRLTWAGLLKEHGPVREYRHPAAREDTATPDGMADFDAQVRWADGPDDDYGDDLGGWNRSAPVSQEGGKP